MTVHNDPQPATPEKPADPGRLLRLPRVLDLVGLGRSSWFDLVRRGEAPKPVKDGRTSRWVESEVRQFIVDSINRSRRA